ncbi:MAG: glutamine-hydrolyzing carbamoyl-phosphate synthase small subunit [Candidatus Eisenbacteria bacterium]|nr:glutamine-hydrolyzing carbamoyl-phosphate synthase small subunit [Candidatus Latescibacterota bacterium]MBD3302706.1 glutamine-hydrolyzing carbamoyl-phosphate synthase small subunit [Candidatus Eisenbacteria bacterium]
MHALLALEDGRIFRGRSFGDPEERGGEVVFCTAMTGYQEVLTDPSYHGQIVVFTAAQIGNYGIRDLHDESHRPWAVGLLVRDLAEVPSHPRSQAGLRDYARRHGLFGITDVDTRDLTLHLRDRGALRGICTTRIEDPDEAVQRARALPPISERNLVADVTRDGAETRGDPDAPIRIVLLDYGAKESIARRLVALAGSVTILPADATPARIDEVRPHGVVLSNGPGDPAAVPELIPAVRHCIERYPTLAICLGHQLAGLALGARTRKLAFGHHGANHPVEEVATGRVYVTAQNHNYAIDEATLPPGTALTHRNLNDGTVEGFRHADLRLRSVQFHPEASPGPHEAAALFEEFVSEIAAGGAIGAA